MNLLYHPDVLRHDTGNHPENRRRMEAFGRLDAAADLPDALPYILQVHTEAYVEKVQHQCLTRESLDGDTLLSRHSFEAATTAASLTLKAMETGGFALVRPPGHHAFREEGHGFCIFNNAAVAARKAVDEGKKVLIIDIDGHLGDGTMDIFYDADEVMYWSLHQYPAYPGNGAANEIGIGKGKGFTLNCPLPPGSADDIMMHATDFMMPAALQFNPDIVAVSAGFDAHWSDPLLQLRASNQYYYRTGRLLAHTFPGKLFAVLEGGYDTEVLPQCVHNFIAGVNGDPVPFPEEETISGLRIWETYEIHLHLAAGLLKKYWKF